MKTRAEYRKLASECVHLAQTASTPQQRRTLPSVACTWLQLADNADTNRSSGIEDYVMRDGEHFA